MAIGSVDEPVAAWPSLVIVMNEREYRPITADLHTRAVVAPQSVLWHAQSVLGRLLPSLAPQPRCRRLLDEVLRARTQFPTNLWEQAGFSDTAIRPFLRVFRDIADLPNDFLIPADDFRVIVDCCDGGSCFGEQLEAQFEKLASKTFPVEVWRAAYDEWWTVEHLLRALEVLKPTVRACTVGKAWKR